MNDFAGSANDHVGIGVSDILHARAFYERAREPLGITLMMSIETDPPQSTPRRLGFGSAGKPYLWLHDAPVPSHGAHIALIAQTHEAVDAFHAAAIAGGGQDNGAPGIRPQYHSDCYAAYVLGPDGVNLEAVCQLTTGAPGPALCAYRVAFLARDAASYINGVKLFADGGASQN